MNVYLLIYDIPEGRGIENPSQRLQRVAFRANLSCWIILESDIPYALLHRLAGKGVTWHAVKFDMAEQEKLVAMCIASLRAEARRVVQSAQATQRRCEESLEGEGRAAVKAVRSDAANVLKRSRRTLNDLRSVASRFGIEDARPYADITNALNIATGIRSAMHERCRQYSDAMDALEATVGANDPVLRAMRDDGIPPLIAADRMEEANIDTMAFRQAFGQEGLM